MAELFRDTFFGKVVRLVTGRKYFQWPEEQDPELWKKYVNEIKSGRMAHHGNTDDTGESIHGLGGVRTRENGVTEPVTEAEMEKVLDSDSSSELRVPVNEASGVKVDPEKGRDLSIIDWYGPNDPENPVNWSHPKKYFVTFQICLLTFSIYIGSAIYSAGIEDITQKFHVSGVAATLGLTLFVAGYGLGPMLWSPMSEVPFIGRNPIYVITLLVFILLQLPTGYAVNLGMLLPFRFLTGFIGSPCLATGGASITDIYTPSKQAYAMAIWGISAVCGPVMGPLVGGFAAEAKGWRWTIWELTWLSSFCFVFLFFFFPETSASNILYRRTMRMRKLTGNEKLTCEPLLQGESMTGKDVVMMILVKPITLNFWEPMVLALNLYIALVYGLLYIWFESFPIVFVQMYGFSLGKEGLSFIGILIGALIVIPPYFAWCKWYLEPRFNDRGQIKPEERLPPAFVGAFAIPICLFWFGWSAGREHWIMPIIGSAWFSVGAFLLFSAVLNYLPDAYPDSAASVLAGNDLMRSSFGAGFPLFATAMYHKLGTDWASSLLAFLGIAFIPIPFFLYKYGETFRVKYSKYARKDF